MFAVIRRYNTYEGMADKMIRRVSEGFVPVISQLRGFVSYHLIDGGDNTVTSFSVFEDQRDAEESTRLATEWVRKNVASLIKTSPIIVNGAVAAHRAAPPAGAARGAASASPGASAHLADRPPPPASA